MDQEIWKDIDGYDGYYQVSSYGNIKSVKSNLIRKPNCGINGYLRLSLWKNSKPKLFLVHRLVAEAFIPNPHNYSQVNHKDENPLNNHADNLEWCNSKYNANYGTRIQRIADTNSIPVVQRTLDGEVVNVYKSRIEAQRETGIWHGCICACINGKRKTAHGYIWENA